MGLEESIEKVDQYKFSANNSSTISKRNTSATDKSVVKTNTTSSTVSKANSTDLVNNFKKKYPQNCKVINFL